MPGPKPKPIGAKIKKFREDKGLTLIDLANETGCSTEYLEWIEDGQLLPPVATLLQLSRALGVSSGAFFKDETPDPVKRKEEQHKRTAHYSYQVLTPAASDKHLKAFGIGIPANDEHTGVGYQHEGEEFVYVLSGEVIVTVGENQNHLAEGESLHFNSMISHHMANPSDQETKLLVILYTP